jgi:hypothetical protein
LVAAVGCTKAQFVNTTRDTPIDCTVSRAECVAETATAGCATFGPVQTFSATTCYNANADGPSINDRCHAAFCVRPEADEFNTYDFQSCSASGTLSDPTNLPKIGTCLPGGTRLSRVDFVQRSRTCVTTNNVSCDSLPLTQDPPVAQSQCINLSDQVPNPMGAWKATLPSGDARDKSVQLIRVVVDEGLCNAPRVGQRTSSLTTGLVATASGSGVSVPVTLTRGFATITQTCDSEGGCVPSALDSFRADVADLTISGVQVSKVTIALRNSAPLVPSTDPDATLPVVKAHGLAFLLRGLVGGVDSILLAENDRAWTVDPSSTFRLQGTLVFRSVDQSGHLLPITVSANITGAPASPQVTACANLSSRDRLFGFEDVQSWTSSQAALSLVTTPLTQGCGALGITGQGYMPITGASFPTSGLSVTPAMSVDLFVPSSQPNPFWTGALQAYLSCPSGGVSNQYIGQVELTSKPENAFSTLRFPLPSGVSNTLNRGLSDCFFSFALNVNPTNRTWILDNLRFTQ